MYNKKTILVFGGGNLQISLINCCKSMDLFTIVIDPDSKAKGKSIADLFEVIDGQDFKKTCDIIEKYKIKAIITSATDKPLVMMAKLASKYNIPFYSEQTALLSTDKFLMKKTFQLNDIPCPKGYLVSNVDDISDFPVIVKPRDNSGGRGVSTCASLETARISLNYAFQNTKQPNVVIEEVIDGYEYSIEAIHFKGKTEIIQFTEKTTTSLPYHVELGHIQPANLDQNIKEKIVEIIDKIAIAFKFDNCASHTELKVNEKGIFILETSPRLGGDYITSMLTPLSSGINIEKMLIEISLGNTPIYSREKDNFSGIFYFNLPTGTIKSVSGLKKAQKIIGVKSFELNVSVGSTINEIKNSIDRIGFVVLQSKNMNNLLELKNQFFATVKIEMY